MSRPYSSLDDINSAMASQVLEETKAAVDPSFANEMGMLAYENIFHRLWMRQGLDRRARSLVTLGILLALRATDEFKIHVMTGINNGLTVAEIEEILYHATAYAGFPAVNAARLAAADALRKEGLIGGSEAGEG